MATREAESQLAAAQAYRAGQVALAVRFLRDSLALWPVLDKARIGQTSPQWLRLQMALIRRMREQSATAAGRYYRSVGRSDAPSLPALPDETIVRNLLRTGPGGLSQGLRSGMSLDRADKAAQVASGRAGARLVLSGGRDLLQEAVKADPKALGWMRVTDGDPCAFCAMLASRGAIYKTAATAGGLDPRDLYGDDTVSHYHDGCGCTVVPVFTRDAALPADSKRYEALWVKATRGLSGDEARKAFRRAVEGRSLPDDPISQAAGAA